MNKKILVILVVLIGLFVFWQWGGIDYLLARTVFAPDYSPDTVEEEPLDEQDEPVVEDEEIQENIETEETVYMAEDLEYELEIIGEGMVIPWEVLPLSDGEYLITERPGRVVKLGQGVIYTVSEVEHTGEAGLLGMEKSPDFNNNNEIYLYYTYSVGNQLYNRVSRFIYDGNTLTDEVYILDRIPGARFHNGGRIKFGPDEKLYITTGDAQVPTLSQDLNSLAGKILRINPDGSIPHDNPFEDSMIFAYGLRNPQGLSWNPRTGDLYASDHGPSSQDEINRILPGKNYGWPIVTCTESDPRFEDPISCYSQFTLAPSGISFLPWDNLKETSLFVAGLRGNMVLRIDLNEEGDFIKEEVIINDLGRIRTINYYADYFIIVTNNRDGRGIPIENDDRVIRLTPILP